MDIKIQAAIVGAVTAIIVTLINWFIQKDLKDRELKQKKQVAEGTVALYLCQLRLLYANFSNEEDIFKSSALSISINQNNLDEVNKIIEIIEPYDSYLTIKFFYIRQSMSNIKIYMNALKSTLEKDDDDPTKDPRIQTGCIMVDAKRGLKDLDEALRHSCKYAESETLKFLLSTEEFNALLQEVLGDERYEKLKKRLKV